ncbi:MAG: Stp1/IreP family PP2C-type Ser/Thr phosphatase [Candidatus Hydrogenedentes bacterium]|nr:Stp1/IreP family PP2C-type Ser/Thr phosphatase [Candidatus Hydrogenedentota bacterium]
MRLDVAGISDKGKKKDKNEDYFGIYTPKDTNIKLFEEGALLAVADGLGGHIAGNVASKLAVSIIKDILQEEPPSKSQESSEKQSPPLEEFYSNILKEYFQKANESIYRTNKDLVKGARPMGTTALAMILIPGKAFVANVGDSRAYHIRNGEILERTEDHSWVDEQIKLGIMSREEAESHSRKHVITRSIGTHSEIEVDTYKWFPVSGDILLLCTDGLVNMVPDDKILEIINEGGTAEYIAQRLIDQANENGGKDNITVIVAIIDPNPLKQKWFRLNLWWKRWGKIILKFVALIGYGFLAGAIGFLLRGFLNL